MRRGSRFVGAGHSNADTGQFIVQAHTSSPFPYSPALTPTPSLTSSASSPPTPTLLIPCGIMPLLLPTIEEEDKLSWLRLLYRYRRQFHAMAAASVLHIAGGMKLAWSIYETPTGGDLSRLDTHLLMIGWFVGAAVGAIAASTFVQRVSKNVAHFISAGLLILGAILFIAAPTSFAALLSSCLLEGSAYGINQVQGCITGGEVAHKDIRGLVLACERIFLWLGICLQLFYTRLWYAVEPETGHMLHVNQLHGVVVLCLALTAIVLTLLYRLESPLLLTLRQRDLAATYVMKRLQGAHYPSIELIHLREEYKQLLSYDAGMSAKAVMLTHNLLPLLKVALLRCFVMLSLSLPFNRAFLTASWTGYGCDMNCLWRLALCGLAGSLIGGLLVDKQGRRWLAVIALLLTGIFIFIVAGVSHYIYAHIPDKLLCHFAFELIANLLLLYQLALSAGVAVSATAYMAEAFSTVVKAKCVAAVVVCEQLLQIALTLIVFYVAYGEPSFFFAIGAESILLGLLVLFFMPETKYLSLYECLLKFKKVP